MPLKRTRLPIKWNQNTHNQLDLIKILTKTENLANKLRNKLSNHNQRFSGNLNDEKIQYDLFAADELDIKFI